MSALGALPNEIHPLDRSVPYVDERSGRTPRRGRAFPDPSREERDKHKQPEPPTALEDEPEPATEPGERPHVDIRVLGRFLPTRQILTPTPAPTRAH